MYIDKFKNVMFVKVKDITIVCSKKVEIVHNSCMSISIIDSEKCIADDYPSKSEIQDLIDFLQEAINE